MKISKGTLRKIILEYLSLNEKIIRKKGYAGYEYKYDTATGKITITKAPAGAYRGVVNPKRDKKNKKAYDAILNMHFPDYATQDNGQEKSTKGDDTPPAGETSTQQTIQARKGSSVIDGAIALQSPTSTTSSKPATSDTSNTSSTSSTSNTSNTSNTPDASEPTDKSDGSRRTVIELEEPITIFDPHAFPAKITTSKKINFKEFIEQIKESNADGEYVYNYNEFLNFYPDKTFDAFSNKEYDDIDTVISKISFFYSNYGIVRSPYGKGSSLKVNVFFQPLEDQQGKNILNGRLFFDLPGIGKIDDFILNNVKYNRDKNTFSGK